MKISNKGFSLIELLVSLMILGILSSIATISYSGYMKNITHSDFKTHSYLFASAVQNCITTSGWRAEAPGTGGSDCKHFNPCSFKYNCDTAGKIGFTCPKDADCTVYTNVVNKDGTSTNLEHKKHHYHCLYIQTKKPLGGNHIQYITRVNFKEPNKYQIWKSKVKPDFTTPLTPKPATCKKQPGLPGNDQRLTNTHERVYSSDNENP